MATQRRINELTGYVADWKKALERAVEHLNTLLEIQSKQLFKDTHSQNWLQQRIQAADAAVAENTKCLTRMESLLGRAQSGEPL